MLSPIHNPPLHSKLILFIFLIPQLFSVAARRGKLFSGSQIQSEGKFRGGEGRGGRRFGYMGCRKTARGEQMMYRPPKARFRAVPGICCITNLCDSYIFAKGGCLLFENQIFGEINLVAWIQAVYSILQFIRPIDKCFGSFINGKRRFLTHPATSKSYLPLPYSET